MSNYFSIPGAQAGADLSANQYRAVRFDSTERQYVAITNANAQIPIGIQQDDPASSCRPMDVAFMGICKAELSNTVSYGDSLICEPTGGRLLSDAEVVNGGAVDIHHIAFALEAGAVGEIIDVLLHSPDRIGSE